jgi:hypothetical protein
MNKKKKLITILLSIVTISLSAQKLPNPPKADAIGKESLWESFEKKNTYDILVRTKKIAILPVTSAYFAKKIDADSLQKFQNMLTNSSLIIQKAYYIGLIKKSLSAAIQNPEETIKILNQKGLLNPETLNQTPKNTLCFILGVDAVMFVDITMELTKATLVTARSEEIAIGLRLYEKSNGDFFWANRLNVKLKDNLFNKSLSFDFKTKQKVGVDIIGWLLEETLTPFNEAIRESFQSIPFVIK